MTRETHDEVELIAAMNETERTGYLRDKLLVKNYREGIAAARERMAKIRERVRRRIARDR
jgi:hypothetical protein